MDISIDFAKGQHHPSDTSVIIKSGLIHTVSAPQSLPDHYRDFTINHKLLLDRKLSQFFICNEPLFNIEYLEDGLVSLSAFNRQDGGFEKVSSTLFLSNFVYYICGIVTALNASLRVSCCDVKTIDNQIAEDLKNGLGKFYCNDTLHK